MRNESDLRKRIVNVGRSLFSRGLTAGSSGNLSVRLDDGVLITPTNSSLGDLEEDRIAKIDMKGNLVSGGQPSKELPLHLVMYEMRPQDDAVVHLHSSYSAAVSCMKGLDQNDCIPPLTAYYVMKVNRLPLVPYHRPGDPQLAHAIGGLARQHRAVLLSNHGPLVSGQSLEGAMYAIEELEETAKIFLLLYDRNVSALTVEQIAELTRVFELPK